LRDKKGALINEKKAIRAKLDTLKAAGDKLLKEKKDQESSVKFSNPEDIDKEIAKLQRRQETTSMSLPEEKKLIKEIDALKASKSRIQELKSTAGSMEANKLDKKAMTDLMTAKDKEIDAVTKEIDVAQAALKEDSDKNKEQKSAREEMIAKREEIKKAIADLLAEKDTLRDEFRVVNDNWYNYQRAIKAQKKMKYDEEKAKREEEKAAYLAKIEEEEAKKIPYEEEQALCDYLADYLERTYITGEASGPKIATKKEDIVAVTDDPFSGFKPIKKDEEVEYFGKGKGKKKRQRAPKKADEAAPFTLNVDSFEQFGLISMSPPTSRAEVEKSIAELREKKEWYKKQARGSVPTARDIRKQNEKAAAKLRSDVGSGAAVTPAAGKGGAKLDLTDTEEFVPLGKGASNAVDASSWGNKTASA